MRYINKELPVFKEKGETIVYRFLTEAYAGDSHYEGLEYENFRKPEYRTEFESLLREEQYNICCYCMRDVSNSPISLEHIIPRACNKDDFKGSVRKSCGYVMLIRESNLSLRLDFNNNNPMNSSRTLHKLLRVIFPEVLMEYFEISGWHDDSAKIEVWLDEKNYLERSDYKSGTVISHGFTDEKVIQDFPLRGKPVYLHVRRRRWYDKASGETFSYTYDDLTAEGTKLTPEFVAFLKEED